MSDLSKYRRARMGLPPEDPPAQAPPAQYQEQAPPQDGKEKKKHRRLPYWLDGKTMVWIGIVVACIIGAIILKI